ncbi:YlbF family regulator, partial [Dysosmobacter welbionis]
DADGQHQEHIHADQRQYQHGEVGNDLDDVERQISHFRHGLRPAYDQQHDDGDDSRRQGNEEVHPELVPELAALGAGGGNGGV